MSKRSLASACPSNLTTSTFQQRLVFTYSGYSTSRLKAVTAGSSGAIYTLGTDDSSISIVSKINADLSHSWSMKMAQTTYENTIEVSQNEAYLYVGLNLNPVHIFQMDSATGSVTRIFAT